MANFDVDPHPFVPKGFTVEYLPANPLLRHEVFVAGCHSPRNEDLAIVRLHPPVDKQDFEHLEKGLRKFFDVHETHVLAVEPCPIGDAYVRFSAALSRERFLGPVFDLGVYRMIVSKHDEGVNARSFELDREAWVMMLAFPEDLRCDTVIAKSVSSFGIMVHWHESLTLARVIVKVYLNDDRKIPASVKVNVGMPSKGKSWTVPVFVLKKQNVAELPDEESYVSTGPLHGLPAAAARWAGAPTQGDGAFPGSDRAGNTDMQVDRSGGQGSQGTEAQNADAVQTALGAVQGRAEIGTLVMTVPYLAEETNKIQMVDSDIQAARDSVMAMFDSVSVPENRVVKGAVSVQDELCRKKSDQVLQDGKLGIHGTDPPTLSGAVIGFVMPASSKVATPDSGNEGVVSDKIASECFYSKQSRLVQGSVVSAKKLKSIAIGRAAQQEAAITVIPSMYEKLGGRALEKIGLEALEQEEDVKFAEVVADEKEVPCDSDVEILEEAPARFSTPRKRRAKRLKEELDSVFLRRSRRLSAKPKVFKMSMKGNSTDQGSSKKCSSCKSKKSRAARKMKLGQSDLEVPEASSDAAFVTPLAVMSPEGLDPAPDASKEVLQGLGEGFRQIEPGAVSAALLKQEDLDE